LLKKGSQNNSGSTNGVILKQDYPVRSWSD